MSVVVRDAEAWNRSLCREKAIHKKPGTQARYLPPINVGGHIIVNYLAHYQHVN